MNEKHERPTKEHEPEPESETPVIGEGYRWLGKEEILRNGDEYHTGSAGAWCLTHCAGNSIEHVGYCRIPYRRKITPEPEAEKETCESITAIIGEGYRRLDKDEVISKGDEWYNEKEKRWMPEFPLVGKIPYVLIYRRKITPKPVRKFIRHSAEFLEDGKVKVQITAQSHRLGDFGEDGTSYFKGGSMRTFGSWLYPNASKVTSFFYVRGSRVMDDLHTFILTRIEYADFRTLCDEYNEFFSGVA